MDNTVKIKCETEGFEEATEQVEALVEAYDGFPSQVNLKGLRNCTINIFANQIKNDGSGIPQTIRRGCSISSAA